MAAAAACGVLLKCVNRTENLSFLPVFQRACDKWLIVAVNAMANMSFVFALLYAASCVGSGSPQRSCLPVLLPLAVGLLLPGPLNAFLLDRFRRRNVGAAGLLLLGVAGWFLSECGLGGVATAFLFLADGIGLALTGASLGASLVNDVTQSESRDKADVVFAAVGAAALLAGASLACLLPRSLVLVRVAALGIPLLGVAVLLFVRIPFRAPLNLCRLSADRFWLRGGEVLFLSLLLLCAAQFACLFSAPNALLALSAVAALLPLPLAFRLKAVHLVVAGYALALLGLLLRLALLPPALPLLAFGLSAGLSACGFMRCFLARAGHCRRGTALHTFFLAVALGLVCGVALWQALALASVEAVASVAVFASVVAFWRVVAGQVRKPTKL